MTSVGVRMGVWVMGVRERFCEVCAKLGTSNKYLLHTKIVKLLRLLLLIKISSNLLFSLDFFEISKSVSRIHKNR